MKIIEVRTTKRGRLFGRWECGHESRVVSAVAVAAGVESGKRFRYKAPNQDVRVKFATCPVRAHAKRSAK